jgi:phospholipid-binding lipoprotein MlaA
MMYHKAKKNKIVTLLSVLCCSSVLVLSGCATTTTTAIKSNAEVDPYEDFNRSMFSFNQALDEYVAEPVVEAYNWVTPHFVQTGIGNFFSNLKDINVVLNDMMQAKFLQSGEDTGRFLLNSTVGLAGLFDVATEVGLPKHEEDFDQTFAVWGIPQGPYLVLPILGPTTGRGITGSILDTATNPASYVGYPIQALSLLNERANADSSLKIVDEAALDTYAFTREAFLQARKNLITDGKAVLTDDLLDADVEKEVKNTNAQIKDDSKGFKQVGDNFSNAEKSFNGTARSFKAVSDKLDLLAK